jgi:DNA processing protein
MTTDDQVAASVLAGLASMSRRRLQRLLLDRSPTNALQELRAGRAPGDSMAMSDSLLERLTVQARAVDEGVMARLIAESAIGVTTVGSAEYPQCLADDPERPGVLFYRGELSALNAERVGIVGTRNATAAGRATAEELGAALANAPSAIPRCVAVVGNGLDECYPKRNVRLWEQLIDSHLLLSEWPPGTAPDAFRFPLRNRIIAALSRVLVVVESREHGGSLITARACLDRGIEVMVVPGSPKSRASAGTNLLLRDGATPATSVVDILEAVGSGVRHLPAPVSMPLDAVSAEVVERCAAGPATLDSIVADCELGIGLVAMAVADLLAAGTLCERDGWIEVAGSRLVHPVTPQ